MPPKDRKAVPSYSQPHRRSPDALTPSQIATPIDDPKIRGIIVGAIAAGATVRVAASIAMAAGYDVPESMIHERKAQDSKFRRELETAAARSDAHVALSLYRKATQGDGDTTAMIFWLKNRQPHLWRDRKELEIAIPDVTGTLRSAAERARERRRQMMEAMKAGAVPAEVVEATNDEGGAIVPFSPDVPGGNGNGNGGNGHGP